MLATFKPIIIPGNKRKDGTYPVKIRVTFKGVTRRLPTNLVCYPGDLTRSLKIKNATILMKADELIRSMRKPLEQLSSFDMETHDVDWIVAKIKDAISGESFRLDFFEWGERYVLTKSPTTRYAYTCAMNTFARFLGERAIDINDITRTMLLEFMEMVDAEPKMHYDMKTRTMVPSSVAKIPKGAASRHLMKLAAIFKAAKERYNDDDAGRILIPRSPFDNIAKVFPPSHGQTNLGQELMQRIISYETQSRPMRIALDAFIVSFGLMGANMADLYNAEDVEGVWNYNRQKTRTRRADNANMRVVVPEVLAPYIARLKNGRGSWWLPALHEFANGKDFCTARTNRLLEQWCKENNVAKFTFYAARHTWATLARKAGVDKSTIDDCLCHKGDYATTDIYIEKPWELLDATNNIVLGMFTW